MAELHVAFATAARRVESTVEVVLNTSDRTALGLTLSGDAPYPPRITALETGREAAKNGIVAGQLLLAVDGCRCNGHAQAARLISRAVRTGRARLELSAPCMAAAAAPPTVAVPGGIVPRCIARHLWASGAPSEVIVNLTKGHLGVTLRDSELIPGVTVQCVHPADLAACAGLGPGDVGPVAGHARAAGGGRLSTTHTYLSSTCRVGSPSAAFIGWYDVGRGFRHVTCRPYTWPAATNGLLTFLQVRRSKS